MPAGSVVDVVLFQDNPELDFYFVEWHGPDGAETGWVPAPYLDVAPGAAADDVAHVRMIAAMSPDRVIGSEDGLPWDVPADYAHFVASVRGGAVVMGRRSYAIFGADLEDVHAIVVTRSADAPAGTQRAGDVETALAAAAATGRPVWVAGGASIYAQALPFADALHLSIVPGRFEGDAWFPAWDERAWALAEEEAREGYVFRRYERIAEDPS